MPSDELTTREAADILKINRELVTHYCQSGRLKARKFGWAYLIRRADLEEFAQQERSVGYPKGRPRKAGSAKKQEPGT